MSCALLLALALPAVPQARAGDEAKLELGRAVFLELAEPHCAVCHTLADAGSTGDVGPNLDGLRPTEDRVRAAVMGGLGIMPAFEDLLSPEQIDAVAYYVSTVAGRGK